MLASNNIDNDNDDDAQLLNDNEYNLLNSDDIEHHNHITTIPTAAAAAAATVTTIDRSTNNSQNKLNAPLIIKKLSNKNYEQHQQQSIKISITNRDLNNNNNNSEKMETSENNVYETINNNENENIQLQNEETIKNSITTENNNITTSTTTNNTILHVKSYTPPLFDNTQFTLRYKDPKTGKLLNKVLLEQHQHRQNNLISPNGSIDENVVNKMSNTSRIDNNNNNNNSKKSTIPSRVNLTTNVTLFRTQSSRVSKTKSVDRNFYNYRSGNASPTNSNAFNWKSKNERNPIQQAPDRLYLNTYMEHHVNNNRKSANNAKINNIKFQGVTPNYNTTRSRNADSPITTSQVFEQIFEMNSQFINSYYPQVRRQNSVKLLSRAHTLPGHIALESIEAANTSNNGPSRRPLKFENPSLYKTQNLNRTALNTQRSTKSSINYNNDNYDDYDLDSIEIPIILKSPNSVNSYINYLKTKNNGIFS